LTTQTARQASNLATFDQFILSLEQDFGEQGKGKPFEVFCKWFLENDPEWSKTVDKVWLWDDYPYKWQRQDLGTDLVFRDNDGLIWAVQAKCYGEHRTTTKGDMNSFLADTGRKEVDRRLWLQSTNKIEAKAEKTLKGQDKPVTVFMLNDFRDAQLEYPSSFADLHQAKVKDKPTPDPHQSKAIADATSGLKTSDRGQMIMACGTGKTFTTLWIKEALEAHTTLVLLPSLSLLSQTMREWAWAGNTDFDILNVCSDKSVGKKTEDMDPADAPFPVTSEVDEITKFLKQPKPKVVFCTYQSSELIAEAQLDEAVPDFDLAVADEAHRCAGKADAGFATILDADKIRASKRLFTTATPRYFGKAIKDAAKARDLAVVGMDNEAVFGPVIHKLTFGQAIEQELLTDYQVVIVGVDEPMIREWIENYEIISTDPDNQTDARTLAAKIGMLKAVKDYDLKRVISFHSRVAGAKQFSDELVDVANLIEPANRPEGTFLSDYVSGAMKAGDRKEKIDRLKVLEGYDRGILTNARCLAEGVDVPSLDGVAFIDPRDSQVEIIQAVGRAIRKVRGAKVQKKGTIVLPVFIEDGDDHETSIEASNFKPVWDVLKALRAHDDDMASTLDQYRTNMAKNASQSRESISDKIVFDLPVSVDAEFSSALRTVLVEASTASWEFWFGLLEVYVDEFETALVPDNTLTPSGLNLGIWCRIQRGRYKNGLISDSHIKRLEQLQGWSWSPLDDAWDAGFQALRAFVAEFGHASPEAGYVNEEGFKLGRWVVKQRANGTVSDERKGKLNGLPFWVWSVRDAWWEEGYRRLVEYENQFSSTDVKVAYVTPNGFKLGVWVRTQRTSWEQLTDERRTRLLSLSSWSKNPAEASFNRIVSILKQHVQRYGHLNLPADLMATDTLSIRDWCNRERSASRKSGYPNYRYQALENVDQWTWDHRTAAWKNGFEQLVKFKKDHGHCIVPSKFKVGNFGLGQWVVIQRSNLKTMTAERKQKLDAIGFVWNLSNKAWEEGFSKLLKFKKTEGHCNVPRGTMLDHLNLYNWCAVQKRNGNKMVADRKQRLEDIGFIWGATKDKP
jgi:superfamily II DNA or RNA helicase